MIQGLAQIGQRVAVIARKLAIPAENIYDCQRGSPDDQKRAIQANTDVIIRTENTYVRPQDLATIIPIVYEHLRNTELAVLKKLVKGISTKRYPDLPIEKAIRVASFFISNLEVDLGDNSNDFAKHTTEFKNIRELRLQFTIEDETTDLVIGEVLSVGIKSQRLALANWLLENFAIKFTNHGRLRAELISIQRAITS